MAHFKGSKPSETPGRPNAKTFGHIEGSPVGTIFKDRVACAAAGVHAPTRAGIHGNKEDGCYSIVLSYGYEDDEDNGEIFIYTGQGGRDTTSSKIDQMQGKESWETVQKRDQEWIGGNRALKISCDNKKLVRVIRGASRKKGHSHAYAPVMGYRYDGLYWVTEYWRDIGKTGFKTCKFRMERQSGQKPLPVQVISSISAGPPKPKNGKRARSTSPMVGPDAKRGRSESPVAGPSRKRLNLQLQPPRPAYRPTEEQLARLKGSSKSKSPSILYPNPSTIMKPMVGGKPILQKPTPARGLSNSGELDIYDSSDNEQDDLSLVGSEDSGAYLGACPASYGGAGQSWNTVKGKQKLPSSLAFRRKKT